MHTKDAMASRPRPLRRRLPVILALILVPGAAAAQGMALTAPRVAALSPRTVPLPPPRPGETREAEPIAPAGRLPNQTTGSRRDRVVRDICIGC